MKFVHSWKFWLSAEGLTECLSHAPRFLLRDCISKNLSQNLLWANTVQYLFRSPVFCPFGKVTHKKSTGRVSINDIKVGGRSNGNFPFGYVLISDLIIFCITCRHQPVKL